MAQIYDSANRLHADPLQTDLARGFSAEIADPAWLLGRQWQLGEHKGEDASSPVRLTYSIRLTPIEPLADQPHLDPRTVPAEAIVESEPGDWWTPGRRVAAGRSVEAAAQQAGAPLPAEDGLRLLALPVPYDVLDGTGYDGQALWRDRNRLNLDPAWFAPLQPPAAEPTDLWDPAELSYSTEFRAGGAALTLTRHDGGDLDWYSVDATGMLDPAIPSVEQNLYPGRVRYPGAPLPRWWQIEDSKADIGGYPPDRAHFATLLLIDLIVNQSDDWFSFTVDALAGHVATLEKVVVFDSFDKAWTLTAPTDWSMFATDGLERNSLVVWAPAATPLVGPVLDEVVIGIDEDANLVWAVEQRLHGRSVLSDESPVPEPPPALDAAGRQGFAYRPMSRIPTHWHPYTIENIAGRRRFVQGRAADLSGTNAVLLPEAESDLLIDAAAGGTHPTHQLEPAAIPPDGVRVERRRILARSTDGSPVLWTQRRRQPMLTPPALRLAFDVMEPVPPS